MPRLIGLALLLVCAAIAQTRDRAAEYALILQDPPVAIETHSRSEAFGLEGQGRLAIIRTAQRSLLTELARRQVTVTGTSQVLLNAVFVAATPASAAQLRGLPGVTDVIYMPPLKPLLTTATALIGAAQAQALAPGGAANAGAGMKIGIIDSGIDQYHAAFQDSSLTPPAGFPKYDAGYQSYTNNKVIVARSFVSYTPFTDPNSLNSIPDDLSPRDHVGHGTAIAMIAAGAKNTSPLGDIQGVAPKAFLGNYKVQGSPSVNSFIPSASLVVNALTAALADGMDIVTLAYSEGDPARVGPNDTASQCGISGTATPCDPIAYAVENAVKNGLVVIAGAGNDGALGPKTPTLSTIHTPGTAPAAITVGASTNSHTLFQTVKAVSPNPPAAVQSIKALFDDGPQRQTALTAPIKDVAQLGNSGDACNALTAGSLTGAIALVQRSGACAYSVKINNAQQAGAIAVVILQTSGSETPVSSLGTSDTGIPAVMVGYTDGLALRSWVDANSTATVTLDPAFAGYSATANVVADFSSRGPAIATLGIKPEIVAPGSYIYTATQKLDPNSPMYHASGYTAVSGTSMAVGMVAGAAALVKQKTPSLTAPQIKAAVVNTATAITGARLVDAGTGLLNAAAAVGAATVVEPGDSSGLSFGAIGVSSLPISKTLNATNLSSAAQTVVFTTQQTTPDGKATLSVNPSSLTLQPGQKASVVVSLTGTQPSAGSYEGTVLATVNGSAQYRVPYLYIVGDGVIDSVFPTIGGFVGAEEDTAWLIGLRAVDRYGAGVAGKPVTWTAVCANGTEQTWSVGCGPSGPSFFKDTSGVFCTPAGAYCVDTQTYNYGIAGARVNLGTALGDQLFRATVGGQTLTFYGYAYGYQTIANGGVVDAASYQAFPSPKGYAPGSYLALFGSYLAPASQGFSTPSLPYGMSSTTVSFFAANGRFPGRVAFVSPNQINVQIPWELQGQSSAKMIVQTGWDPSSTYTVPLTSSASPGLFAAGYDSSLRPYVAAFNRDNAWWTTPALGAKKGDILYLYANGLGPVTNQPASGDPAGAGVATTNTPTVSIGGVQANVIASGMTKGWIGVYEVDITVPANAPSGIQPVFITIGGSTSALAYIVIQ